MTSLSHDGRPRSKAERLAVWPGLKGVFRLRYVQLTAGFVIASAGDFHFFAACGFAVVAAVLFIVRDNTLARLACALTVILAAPCRLHTSSA